MTTIRIFTDGSCLGNPGPGGFGFVAVKDEKILTEYSGSEVDTTNNRMELLGAIEAIKTINDTSLSSFHYPEDAKFELTPILLMSKKGLQNG